MAESDPAQLLKTYLDAGQNLMGQFASGALPGEMPDSAVGFENSASDFMAEAARFAKLQEDYVQQISDYWSGLFGASPKVEQAPHDRRFAADAWKEVPGFDALKGAYFAYANFLRDSVDSAPVDDQTRAHMRYAVGQYLDALSPANFFATNPEALKLAQETGGQSLIDGMGLFLKDLAKGRISMADESAFEVGRNVAATEGAVVFENDLIQLIQYAPKSDEVYERPLVIIPPCINKFYILDLQPENSFVRYAVACGHTVFLVSWRNITSELAHLTWDDYLKIGVIKAIEVARRITKAERANTLGFCIGGTLLGCALAVLAAKGKQPAASLTLLTTLLDFSETGEIGELVSEESVVARETAIGQGGILHGKELAFVFSSLRANDLIWQYVVNSYLKGKAPPAFDLLYWNSDAANLPGPMFCWYVRNTYLENNLTAPGKTHQCGVKVDLGRLAMPAFLYASREDHIVPWGSAYAAKDLLKGEATFVLGASGHIAGVINPAAKNKRNYWVGGPLDKPPDDWLAAAQSVPGSWWPKWSEWLSKHAGEKVPARNKLGNKRYRAIEPAPGRYVKEQAV
jgi:polyhydroxyalkanoate synthase